LLERALALDNPMSNADIQIALAEALGRIGKDDARARRLAGEALAAYQRAGHEPGTARARAWLAEHPRASARGLSPAGSAPGRPRSSGRTPRPSSSPAARPAPSGGGSPAAGTARRSRGGGAPGWRGARRGRRGR